MQTARLQRGRKVGALPVAPQKAHKPRGFKCECNHRLQHVEWFGHSVYRCLNWKCKLYRRPQKREDEYANAIAASNS